MKKSILYVLVLALFAGLIPTNADAQAQAAESAKQLLAEAMDAAGAQAAAGGTEAEAAAGALSPADIQGNWAEASIKQWLKEGLITGFQDGTFRPNAKVTRAELAALVNRVVGYTATASTGFKDVPQSKWYAAEVARALAAGYMQGGGDGAFRPDGLVTRQEAAVLLARLLKLDTDKGGAESDRFEDAKGIAPWARGAVGASVAAGMMQGYDGNLFKATQPLTRAETVAILERARGKIVQGEARASIAKAGIYGPASGAASWAGDVVIDAANVTLRNVTITGDLVLGEKVGEGDVTLDHVMVQGTMTVKGGGKNSVHVLDSALTRIVITKVDGQVRVVAEGTTAIDQVVINTGSTLEVVGGNGAGFGTVTVSATGEVTLNGDFPNVVVTTAANLTLTGGSVGTLTLTDRAEGAQVKLDGSTQVQTVNAGASASVTGAGTIGVASITANGVSIAQTPKSVIVADGVKADVGGSVKQGGGTSGGNTGNGNNNGNGNGGTTPTEPQVPVVTVAVSDLTMGGFAMALSPAVPELTASDILVMNEDGMPAMLTSILSTDNGASFEATGYLTGGATYSISIAKPGYVFKGVTSLAVPDTAVINGAMLSPDKTKLSMLFSKTLASLPASDAGFTVTEQGVPVVVQSVTQRANQYQVDLQLDHAAQANLLRVSYTPGTIVSTDDKPLAAFVNRIVGDGSTPSGMASYYRMDGKTASQIAVIFRDELSLDTDDTVDALMAGGFNTNAVVQALYDTYDLYYDQIVSLLIQRGVGIYPLMIAMQNTGNFNIMDLGKAIGYFAGDATGFLQALQLLEHQDQDGHTVTGYTVEEAIDISGAFSRKDLADGLKTVYGLTDEQMVEKMPIYRSFAEDIGMQLKDVYSDTEAQAATAMFNGGATAEEAGQTLRDVYQTSPQNAVVLLRNAGNTEAEAAGYSASDLYGMLGTVYTDETGESKAAALRDAGFPINEVYERSVGPQMMRALYAPDELTHLFRYNYGWTATSMADYFAKAGFTATDTGNALKNEFKEAVDKDKIIKSLLGYDYDYGKYTDVYDFGQVALAIRRLYNDSASSVAQIVQSYGAPRFTAARDGEITIGEALNTAGYSWDVIIRTLAPSSSISEAEAVGVLQELRHAGFSIEFLAGAPLKMLMDKVGWNYSNWEQKVKLLQDSSVNTTTNETIPGYTPLEIAQFVIGTAGDNATVKAATLANALVPYYGVNDSIAVLKEALDPTPTQLLNLLIASRFCNGNLCSGTVAAKAIKDNYDVDAAAAAKALRGVATSGYSSVSDVQNGISGAYGIPVGSVELLTVLRKTGFSAVDIVRGATSSMANLKGAGFNATELGQALFAKNTASAQLPAQLRTLGYSILEVTEALRNLLGGANSESVKTNVTSILVTASNNREITDSLDAIGEALGTVFGVDPFATMAQGARDNGVPALVAAQQLKSSFNVTDPTVMAIGLKSAGYAQGEVLTAIFQIYADGNFMSTGLIDMMKGVVNAAYPGNAYPIDLILPALGMTNGKQASELMSNLGQSAAEAAGLLNRAYGLSPADALGTMFNAMGYSDKKAMIVAVGQFFQTDGYALFASYQRAHGHTAGETYAALQSMFNMSDGVEIARYLDAAGYGQVDTINAVRFYYMGDDARADAIAKTIVQIYGNSSADAIAMALKDMGYPIGSTDLAIKAALPNVTQLDRIKALLNAPYYISSVFYVLSTDGRVEQATIDQLRNLGFDVTQTSILLGTNNDYTLKEKIATIRDLGYPLRDLAKVNNSAQSMGPAMYELGYSIEDTALIMTLVGTPKTARLMAYLYTSGWRNPADIARGSLAVGMRRLDIFWEMRSLSLLDLGGKWTPAIIGRAIAEGTDLSVVELGQSVIRMYERTTGYMSRMDMFDAIAAVKDYMIEGLKQETGGAAGDLLGILTELGDSVTFMALHDAGLNEKEAARMMKQKGWDWIPATIQLEQAGYSSGEIWDALWDVYRNEIGLLILNTMSFAMPLAELGLTPQLTMIESAAKTAFTKSIMYAVMR